MDKLVNERKDTKTIGGAVESEIYWEFKMAAADRRESMQQAINHAVLLYIDCVKNEMREVKDGK